MKYAKTIATMILSMALSSAYAESNKKELTAQDQSNRKSDVDVARAIRQSIMDDKNLSISAQNVKIIVTERTVTLKGPVNTAQEITTIESKARLASQNRNVVNQLEVTQK